MIPVKSILPLKDATPEQLPLAKSTIYKNHTLGRMPRVIYRVDGIGLVFDFDEYALLCEAAKAATIARATRIHRPLAAE